MKEPTFLHYVEVSGIKLGVSLKTLVKAVSSWSIKYNFVSDVQPEEFNDDSLDVVALNLKPVPLVNPCSSNKITQSSSLRADPIQLEVNMEGQNVVREVNTGASVSVCNQDFYETILNHSNYFLLIYH